MAALGQISLSKAPTSPGSRKGAAGADVMADSGEEGSALDGEAAGVGRAARLTSTQTLLDSYSRCQVRPEGCGLANHVGLA